MCNDISIKPGCSRSMNPTVDYEGAILNIPRIWCMSSLLLLLPCRKMLSPGICAIAKLLASFPTLALSHYSLHLNTTIGRISFNFKSEHITSLKPCSDFYWTPFLFLPYPKEDSRTVAYVLLAEFDPGGSQTSSASVLFSHPLSQPHSLLSCFLNL